MTTIVRIATVEVQTPDGIWHDISPAVTAVDITKHGAWVFQCGLPFPEPISFELNMPMRAASMGKLGELRGSGRLVQFSGLRPTIAPYQIVMRGTPIRLGASML